MYIIHLKDPFVVDTLIHVGHGLKQRTQKICWLVTAVVLVTRYTVCMYVLFIASKKLLTGGVLISFNRCLMVKSVFQNHPKFLEKVYSSQYVWVCLINLTFKAFYKVVKLFYNSFKLHILKSIKCLINIHIRYILVQ